MVKETVASMTEPPSERNGIVADMTIMKNQEKMRVFASKGNKRAHLPFSKA